jgi:hypothetical protein
MEILGLDKEFVIGIITEGISMDEDGLHRMNTGSKQELLGRKVTYSQIAGTFYTCWAKFVNMNENSRGFEYKGRFKKIPVRLLGTRFKARNCISKPGPQEPYRDI